jgi:hypothetical protein
MSSERCEANAASRIAQRGRPLIHGDQPQQAAAVNRTAQPHSRPWLPKKSGKRRNFAAKLIPELSPR